MIVRIAFGFSFFLTGLFEIKTYRTLSRAARNLKEGILMRIGDTPEIVVPVEIPQEIISATRWSLIATIIAFTSLFVLVALEIQFHKTTADCPSTDRQTNANVK